MYCPFCEEIESRKVIENEYAVVIYDLYPVTAGHCLVIPKSHRRDYFELNEKEISAIHALLFKMRDKLQREYPEITGFNIGVNNGEDAGQTVFHCHVHIIPRRKGDSNHPIGGVRKAVDGRGGY